MDENKIKSVLAKGKRIQAIRLIRLQTGWGLKKAKEYAETLERTLLPDDAHRHNTTNTPMARHIRHHTLDTHMAEKARQLVIQDRKIEAIKLLHHNTKMGLKEAKNYIDRLALEYSLRDIVHDIPIQELSQPQVEATIRELVTLGREVEAMQLMQLTTGMSIDEAYEHINTLSPR